jgi:putative oxidoreductase
MPPITSAAAQALGRLLMSVIFILSGYAKLNAPEATQAYLQHLDLPLPQLAYYLTVAVEFGGGLLMLIGLQTRLVALVLAAWCIATGLLVHFHPGDQAQMTHYFKNLAMCGGFLQLFAVGGGAWSLDAVVGRRKI